MKPLSKPTLAAVRKALAAWYDVNHRDLPWRKTHDPYRIWISEIMLQQTRVAAVIPYYDRFLSRFPDVRALASASDSELLLAWAGLGYYSRARNLRAAAQVIHDRGEFPSSYAEILTLPGIGPYTAAAISSICFGAHHAVLDGNVMRVLARFTLDAGDLQSAATRQRLQSVAQTLLDPAHPARHNQAVMELGALICIPKSPRCSECPIRQSCAAAGAGLAHELPIKTRKADVRRSRRTLLVAIRNRHILLRQRAPSESLLPEFWELPELDQLPAAKISKELHSFKHAITNHLYEFRVLAAGVSRTHLPMQWIGLERLGELPLTTVTRKALRPVFRFSAP